MWIKYKIKMVIKTISTITTIIKNIINDNDNSDNYNNSNSNNNNNKITNKNSIINNTIIIFNNCFPWTPFKNTKICPSVISFIIFTLVPDKHHRENKTCCFLTKPHQRHMMSWPLFTLSFSDLLDFLYYISVSNDTSLKSL